MTAPSGRSVVRVAPDDSPFLEVSGRSGSCRGDCCQSKFLCGDKSKYNIPVLRWCFKSRVVKVKLGVK